MGRKPASIPDEELKPDDKPRVLAILVVNGVTVTERAPSIPKLRKLLKKYPAAALIEVWRGHTLELLTEVNVKFTGKK